MTSTVSKYFAEKIGGKRQLSSSSSVSDEGASPELSKTRSKQELCKKQKKDSDTMEESLTLQDAVNELKDSMRALASKDDVKQLREEMEKLRTSLSTRIDKLESSVFDLEGERDQLKTEVSKLKKDNLDLQQQLMQQAKATADIRRGQNDQEQHGRQWNLRVYGVTETRGETAKDCADKCIAIFNKQLGVSTTASDVEVAHRSGKPVSHSSSSSSSSSSRPRPIIVRFFSRGHRSQVLGSRKKLKGKGVSVGEDLTLSNYKLLRQVSDHSATMSAWSANGKVIARLKNSKTVRVDIGDDINKLFRDEM